MLKNILMTPVWIAQVFTGAKSFAANPVIGSRILNTLGLHVFRILLARLIAEIRLLFIFPLVPREYRRRLRQDGYLVIENFLEPEQFARLEREIRSCNLPVRECKQGDTLTLNVLLDKAALEQLPETSKVVKSKRYNRLMMYAGSHSALPHAFINVIKNGYEKGDEDPQKNCHSDTFHMTAKSWLYIDDVTEENGPFHYIPGSHRLTLDRLRWEYRQSVLGTTLKDRYSVKGSMRLYEEDEYRQRLPAPKPLIVSKNTLVVGNTFGFHYRGQAKARSSRMALYSSNRGNPFNPFPGIPFRWYRNFIDQEVARHYEREDLKAERNNTVSSWHRVPSEKFHS